MYHIVQNTTGKQHAILSFSNYEDAKKAKNTQKIIIRHEDEVEEIIFNTQAVIVESDFSPSFAIFEKINEEWVVTERELTPEEIKAKQDWKGLEDDLESVELIDSFPETFFERALSVIATSQGAGMYALLMNCFGANQWDKRLKPALQAVKDMLPTPLTNAELEQLNDILATRGFSIVIT